MSNTINTYRHIHANPEYNSKFGSATFRVHINLDTGDMYYSVAVCSKNDNFCYETGRRIAASRFTSGKVIHRKFNKSKTILENIVDSYDDSMPQNFKQAIALVEDKLTGMNFTVYQLLYSPREYKSLPRSKCLSY